MNKYLLTQFTLLLLGIFVILTNNCASEYRTFKINNGLSNCTFEYPSGYKKELEVFDPNFSLFLRKDQADLLDYTNIMVYSYYPNEQFPNALAASKYEIELSSVFEDFELLESSEKSISGTLARDNTYSYSFSAHGSKPKRIVIRDIFFDHGNLVWRISFNSNSLTFNEDLPGFEHLLETFKIQD
jgi:hypothetical protein